MNRINSIYLVTIVLGFVTIFLFQDLTSDAVFFYGFAENKETEISHDYDVLIDEIVVYTGQQVEKGDLLMKVSNTRLPIKISELELEKNVLTIDNLTEIKELKYKLSDLRITRINKLNSIEAKINELRREIELNDALYEGLKSVERIKEEKPSVRETEIKYLEGQLNFIGESYDKEIEFLNKTLARIQYPTQAKKEIIDTRISHLKAEKDKLLIYAPSNGLVGNILCKENENISAFRTLINFYEMNPTLVKGFVHESLLLQVEVGTELEVISSMHPDHMVIGKVIGLGSRIVEIPERLRKIPEIKSYGREVLIRISADNKFLQKEKVMLNTLNGSKKNSSRGFLGMLSLNLKNAPNKSSN